MTRPLPKEWQHARNEQWARPQMANVSLTLPFPPSVNRLWMPRPGGMMRSRRYETWARAAGNEINRQRPGRVRGHYALELLIEDKPRNRPDLGNLEKCVSDILQEHGIIDNDALCQRIALEWSDSVKGAHVSIVQWLSSERRRAAA